MSLYIPGCDLPKEGNKILVIFPDGVVNEVEPGTPYYEAKQIQPHGDLIDRDERIKSVKSQGNLCRLMGEEMTKIADALEKGFIDELMNAEAVIKGDA